MYLHTDDSQNPRGNAITSHGILLLYVANILLVITTAFPVFHSIFR